MRCLPKKGGEMQATTILVGVILALKAAFEAAEPQPLRPGSPRLAASISSASTIARE